MPKVTPFLMFNAHASLALSYRHTSATRVQTSTGSLVVPVGVCVPPGPQPRMSSRPSARIMPTC